MPHSNSKNIHLLQKALNLNGQKILLEKTQFYSEEENRTINIYHVKKSVFNKEKNKNVKIQIFETASEIQVLLCLRDLWFNLNKMELPKDNNEWNKIRQKIEDGEFSKRYKK